LSVYDLPRHPESDLKERVEEIRALVLDLHPSDRQYVFGYLGICPACGEDLGAQPSEEWERHANTVHNDD
jgi:hypothetical protein